MNWLDCLESGRIKKRMKDLEKSKSLFEMAQNRWKYAQNQKVKEDNASIVVEIYYEAVLELIEGLMAKEGFKSDDHECAIEFLSNFYDNVFDNEEINFLQRMRKVRNKSRYEGKNIEVDVAEDYISRAKLIFNKLKEQF